LNLVREYIDRCTDVDVEDLAVPGVPDFVAYDFPHWNSLSAILPQIDDIRVEDDSRHLDVVVSTEVEKLPIRKLLEDLIFVEVKKWGEPLREEQQDWFDKYGDANFDCVLVEVDEEFESDADMVECDSCGGRFKNDHGLNIHLSRSNCGGSGE